MSLKANIKQFPERLVAQMTPLFKEIGEKIANDFVLAIKEASMEEIVEAQHANDKPKRRKASKKKSGRGRGKGARKAAKRTARKAKAKKTTRLARRTPEQIAKTVGRVVSLLKKNREGMRSEEIRTKLHLDVREVPRVLRDAVESGGVVILSGNKRSTTYGIGKKRAKSVKRTTRKAKKPAARKPSRKAVKKATSVHKPAEKAAAA